MDERLLKILIVDDDEDDYIMTLDLLSDDNKRHYDVDWESTYDAAFKSMMEKPYNLCFVDYRLGERTGLELTQEAVQAKCLIPIILLSGQSEEEFKQKAIKAGAVGFLVKGDFDAELLSRTIESAVKK